MSREQRNVEAIRDEIIAAAADLRAVARSEQDHQRNHAADWLDGLFIGITGSRALHEATRTALPLYQGGMGSFQDVGTEESSQAVSRLRAALVHGLDQQDRDS
jgi:hypothetical protein